MAFFHFITCAPFMLATSKTKQASNCDWGEAAVPASKVKKESTQADEQQRGMRDHTAFSYSTSPAES
eukprot:1160137-Pelagomonas_calceolata.AAC.16